MSQREPVEPQQMKSGITSSLAPVAQELGVLPPTFTLGSTTASTPPPNLPHAAVQRTLVNPRALLPNDILQLQRSVGNRAVQRMLNAQTENGQIKLQVGPINDSHEQEADRFADQVVAQGASPLHAAPPPLLRAAPATVVQRKMAFTPEKLLNVKSTKAQIFGAISRTGLSQKKSVFEKVRMLLAAYWMTNSANQESTLLEKMLKLTAKWLKSNANGIFQTKDELEKTQNLQALQSAINAELPKAKKQQAYMGDLTEENQRYKLNQSSKKGSTFQYLSGLGKFDPVDQAHALAKGQSDENSLGMKQDALDLVKKYKLTDAEIAAIKIYTIDDYKYINPSQDDKDSTYTPEKKNARIKQIIPDVKQLYSERGGTGVVISYTNNVVKAVVERGTLKENYVVDVYRRGEGSGNPALLGRGVATGVDWDGAAPPPATEEKGFGSQARVLIKLDNNNIDIKNNDNIIFTDASDAGMQQARKEGQLHGEIAKQGMSKLPDVAKTEVFRGMTITRDELNNIYAPQSVIEYGTFVSTAAERDTSLTFIRRELNADKGKGGNKIGVLLKLYVEEKAKDLSALSLVDGEKEVLLMPGTKFKVDKRFTKPSSADVEGERIQYYVVSAKQITEKESGGSKIESPSGLTPTGNHDKAVNKSSPKLPQHATPGEPTPGIKALSQGNMAVQRMTSGVDQQAQNKRLPTTKLMGQNPFVKGTEIL